MWTGGRDDAPACRCCDRSTWRREGLKTCTHACMWPRGQRGRVDVYESCERFRRLCPFNAASRTIGFRTIGGLASVLPAATSPRREGEGRCGQAGTCARRQVGEWAGLCSSWERGGRSGHDDNNEEAFRAICGPAWMTDRALVSGTLRPILSPRCHDFAQRNGATVTMRHCSF